MLHGSARRFRCPIRRATRFPRILGPRFSLEMKMMKFFMLISFAVVMMVKVGVGQETQAAEKAMETVKDKASYAIGTSIGSSITRDDMDLNLELVFQGIRDVVEDKPRRLTDEQLQAAMATFEEELQKRRQARSAAAADVNAREGKAFLTENTKKPGVVTLPSGLQYKVLKQGTGATPTAQDTVKTHYRGRLIDGTEFDSSYSRGEPATFPVGRVIPGWTEALQKMKVGDKWELYIPSNLAYGPRGTGADIGPNATLIFEIELLDIIQ